MDERSNPQWRAGALARAFAPLASFARRLFGQTQFRRETASQRVAAQQGVPPMSSPALLESFLGADPEYVFPRIVLTQLGGGGPKTRTGPGTVVRDLQGTLELRMFAQERVSVSEAFTAQGEAGEILPDEAFFNLEATAANGSTWTAERFTINESIHGAVDGSDVRAQLPHLTCSLTPFASFVGHGRDLVIHTDTTVASNRVEANGSHHSFTRLYLRATDGSDVDIYQRKGHLLLLARNADHPVSKEGVLRLVEGLAIAAGAQMTVSTEITRSATKETTQVNSIPLPRLGKKIWSPFDPRRDPRSYIEFVSEYARLCGEGQTSFFKCWQSVLAAWDQGVVAAAAPLGSGVECLVREYHGDRLQEKDPAVLAAVAAMEAHLDSALVDERMKKRAKGALKSIAGKSVSAALDALAAEGWFDTEVAQAWGKVRHRSAHGSEVISTESAAQIQEGLDSLLRCLHLFYMLLLIRMRFAGSFFDHSKRGFPPSHLPTDETDAGRTASDCAPA